MNTTDNNKPIKDNLKLNEQIDIAESEQIDSAKTQLPSKIKTTILYSDLTDDTPLSKPVISDNQLSTTPTTETYKIISEQFADIAFSSNSVKDIAELQSTETASSSENPTTSLKFDSPLDKHLTDEKEVATTLYKEPKAASMTDDNILQQSHQLNMSDDDRLASDKMATGIAIENLDVVLKQWYFTVQWQRTSMPKPGLYNKLKRRTQLIDLDLSCLLCNRYGEIIERVWFKNLRDKAESVRHRGDELLGKKPFSALDEEADNVASQPTDAIIDANMNQESIVIYFNRLPPQVYHVVMVVTSYHGYPLSKANQAVCQLSDDEGNIISELAFAKLPSTTQALWFASLTRSADSWRYNTEHQSLINTDMSLIEKEVSENLVRTAR